MSSSQTSIKVKATAVGHYQVLRQPGDVFIFDTGKGSKALVERSSWMEAVVLAKTEPEPEVVEPTKS